MFRFSLVVCVCLALGITAKPFKPENTHEAFQDTVLSMDKNGKMTWEVEPPEDMDKTDYDIDPRMRIWKSMTGNGKDKQPLKAEEDLDDLYHPSVADLLQVQKLQNFGALPDIQSESSQEDAVVMYDQAPEKDEDVIDNPDFIEVHSEEPEQDWDEVYHKSMKELGPYLAPLMANHEAGAEVRVARSQPEKDEDELYHRDNQYSPVQMEQLARVVMGEKEVRVHLEPEEDLDDLYHKDFQQAALYGDDTDAALPVDEPFQRKHSEPEEDLDELYHR